MKDVIENWENENGEDFLIDGPVSLENQEKANIYALKNSEKLFKILKNIFGNDLSLDNLNEDLKKIMYSHEDMICFIVDTKYSDEDCSDIYTLPLVKDLIKKYKNFYNENPEMLEE